MVLTGTGIIVPQEAALAPGDVVTIRVPEIGELSQSRGPEWFNDGGRRAAGGDCRGFDIPQIRRHIFLCCDQTKPKCCTRKRGWSRGSI